MKAPSSTRVLNVTADMRKTAAMFESFAQVESCPIAAEVATLAAEQLRKYARWTLGDIGTEPKPGEAPAPLPEQVPQPEQEPVPA